ncbi:MAG: hypothetical protein AAB337_00610 [Patescibacteria group bacterium]
MNEPTSYGTSIVSWETWEYPKYQRSRFWYVAMGIIGTALLLFSVFSGSFMFAVIILMIGIIFFLSHLREPARIMVHITTTGILIGRSFYDFHELKDFSIVYRPQDVRLLYLDFVSAFHPLTSISLDEADPNIIRTALIPFVLEDLDRTDETLTDLIARLYKL